MFAHLGVFIGGIGLFLLGMWLMTDGLKFAAGNTLRHLLAHSTQTPVRGLLTGIGLTTAVQSSSAVTVASIGFVNAGLLTLTQAIWVIFGSNIGTTMTGWIVAFTGMQIKLDAYALPLIEIGMFIRLTGTASKRAALGQALTPSLRALQNYDESVDIALSMASPDKQILAKYTTLFQLYTQSLRVALAAADTTSIDFNLENLGHAEIDVEQCYQLLKTQLLEAAASGHLSVSTMDTHMQNIVRLDRALERVIKAARRLAPLR